MSLWQDVTYAVRTLRKSPGATLAAVAALALGMGANTAMFSVVDAVLLHSAALRGLRDPGSLVMVWERNPAMMSFLAERMPVALGNYRDWKRQNRSFSGMTALASSNVNVGGKSRVANDRPQRVESMAVEPNFFTLLGVRPSLGRAFTADDEGRNAVMLGAGFFRQRFGNSANLDGKTIRVDGSERAVIGVIPDSFEFPGMWEGTDQRRPQVWVPAVTTSAHTEQELWPRTWLVYARLRPGVTLEQARSEMTAIAQNDLKVNPGPNQGFGINVFSVAQEDVGSDLRRTLAVLQVAVGFVLLIACANVANLLLARAVGREREIAIRLALGAWRWRIVRLMLTESVLLSLLGAAAGLLLAVWSLGTISALAPGDTHGFHELRLDLPVLGFTFVVSVLTGAVFGLVPGLHAARQNLHQSLSQGGRSISGGPQWLRSGMVAGEVALALILLVGAGLMIRSLSALMNVDPGFQVDHLLTLQTGPVDETHARSFTAQLLEKVQHLPGVKSASISSGLPMESVTEANYRIEGRPKTNDLPIAGYTRATETFFRTMGIPIRRGRGFTQAEAEAKDPGVLIVNEAFARKNWPGEDPLGKIVMLPGGDKEDRRVPVVGVIGNLHEMGPDAETRPEIFLPQRSFSDINLAVRTIGDENTLRRALEQAVWSVDPSMPVQQIRAMPQVLHDWPAERRFTMTVLGGFAGLALLLSSLGLYGVLAYVVTLRTRELGIRVALGATAREVRRLVVGQGLRMTALGMAIGLVGALALTRVMHSLVFGVSTYDPLTFAAVVVALTVVTMLASYIPARRATKVDPMEALRME